jgi:hypothetical protein
MEPKLEYLTNTYANDALGANQLDQLIRGAALSITLAVSLEVAQVTNVALVVFGGTVGLVVWVDCVGGLSACRPQTRYGEKRTVRSSAGAAVGVVTKGVDVHATLSVGVVARDVP